ncbi:MAG: glycerophosphodiester phosphodiesterase family protein [Thermoguttaceae bacterium]
MSHAQMICAHRGASYDAPENTIVAFTRAFEQGADAIEGDFYLSKDGRIACFHDGELKRTAKQPGRICDYTCAELKRFDVGAWKAAEFRGERIPTLEEVIEVIPSGKKFFIELKTGPEIVGPLAEILERAEDRLRPEQIVLIAFDKATCVECKKRLPRLKTHWLVGAKMEKDPNSGSPKIVPTAESIARTVMQLGVDGVGLGVGRETRFGRITAGLQEAGVEFHLWTLDDPDVAEYFLQYQPIGITTNRPAFMREKLPKLN